MILSLFKKNPRRAAIEALYEGVASASRAPALYRDLGVPDTVEGRFESVVLHAVLVMRRLGTLPPPAIDVSQEFVDCVFRRFDLALRELGVGDLSVGKRIKKLAEAFYGRADAYDRALAQEGNEELALALGRNLAGADRPSPDLAAYVRACDAEISRLDLDAILSGRIAWPDPLAPRETGR